MKKIRAWVLAALMAVVLCACGEEQELDDISTVDGGALLYKEVNVADIPDGLQSEYERND